MAYTPEIRTIAAFDASNEHTFTYVLNATDFSVKTTEMQIYLNSPEETMKYSGSQDNYNNLSYILPANSLDNGEYYKVRIRAKSIDDVYTNWSSFQSFRCFTQPSISFVDLPSVITATSYDFLARYTQAENEPLNSYKITLYNEAGIEVATSGIKYPQSTEVPLNITETFDNLRNGIFDIEIIGTTLYNTQITSGLVRFTVQYVTPSLYGLLQLENECDKGYITITSNITDISGESEPSPPTYIEDSEGDPYEVDLREDGAYAIWKSDYSLNGNFTLKLWGSNFKPNQTIAIVGEQDGASERFEIVYREIEDEAFVELFVYDDIDASYYIYSDTIDKPEFDDEDPTNSDQLFIWLRRIDNVYDIQIENLGVV